MRNASFSPLSALTRATIASMCRHRTSTLPDLHAGKPLELGPIIDAVVELADLTDVPVPSLRAVAAACGLLAHTLELA